MLCQSFYFNRNEFYINTQQDDTGLVVGTLQLFVVQHVMLATLFAPCMQVAAQAYIVEGPFVETLLFADYTKINKYLIKKKTSK